MVVVTRRTDSQRGAVDWSVGVRHICRPGHKGEMKRDNFCGDLRWIMSNGFHGNGCITKRSLPGGDPRDHNPALLAGKKDIIPKACPAFGVKYSGYRRGEKATAEGSAW